METPQEEQWRKDPNNWVWGMFYYNKDDKRLMPLKRIPWMGWTINFAYPKSVWFFVVMLAFFVMVIGLIGTHN